MTALQKISRKPSLQIQPLRTSNIKIYVSFDGFYALRRQDSNGHYFMQSGFLYDQAS